MLFIRILGKRFKNQLIGFLFMMNIERAVCSTKVNEAGLLEKRQHDREGREKQYYKIVDKLNSKRAGDLLVRLNDSPLNFASNEQILQYFKEFNIPITNKSELDLFYTILSDEIRIKEEKERKNNLTNGIIKSAASIGMAALAYLSHHYFKDLEGLKYADYISTVWFSVGSLGFALEAIHSFLSDFRKKS